MKPVLTIRKVKDFKVTGDGRSAAWKKAEWQKLSRIAEGKLNYSTKAKALYSDSGIYFLFNCEDRKLSSSLTEDFSDLYTGDVVEVFLWPDRKQNVYFEFEVSPLGFQLPLLITNNKGTFSGWCPRHFEKDRLTRVKTSVTGGPKKKMAKISGWTAEFYIPFKLLTGLGNVPPSRGTIWRANICRIDYDILPRSLWSWGPMRGTTFHNFNNFGVFRFA